MWRILRAELSTNRYIILFCCIVPISNLLSFWFFALEAFESSTAGMSQIVNAYPDESTISDKEVIERIKNGFAQGNSLMHISLTTTALWLGLAYTILVKGYKKHTYRRQMLLPVTLKKIGLSRITFWVALYTASFVALILVSLLLAHLYDRQFNEKFWHESLSTGAFALCAIPACFIAYDLVGGFTLKYKYVHYDEDGTHMKFKPIYHEAFFPISIILSVVLLYLFKHYAIPHFLPNNELHIMFMLSICLAVLSAYLHQHRKSYLS